MITVAVDLDGVIVEQVIPVLEKLNNEKGLSLNKSDITDWEYQFLETDIKTEIERAERERVFVSNMPPTLGAVRALQVLSSAKNLNVVVATSREVLTDPWNREWLSKNQVPYGKYINTRSDGKTLPGVDILIDDYIGNIEQFIRKGAANRQAILFAQPWNQDIRAISDLIAQHKVRVAHSWQVVLAILGFHSEPEDEEQQSERSSLSVQK